MPVTGISKRNPAGEHALACELVGTQLAGWFGLPIFDFAIVQVTEVDELPFDNGGFAHPGPAFITRAEPGESWGGAVRELKKLVNPEDISRLVVFDTWTRNWDRYAPDGLRAPNRNNVFLSEEAPEGELLLRAMDHTECFTQGRDLTPRIATIDLIRDPTVYGRFPEFSTFLDRAVVQRSVNRLREVSRDGLEEIVRSIPREWDVSPAARDALVTLLLGRAGFVADHIMEWLWPQAEFGFMKGEEGAT
jgi:hypothetical protein